MSVGNVSEFNPKADDYWKNTEHLFFEANKNADDSKGRAI